MRHFYKLAEGIAITPLMDALSAQPELWDQNTLRTSHPGTAHAEVNDIWLWFNRTDQPLEVLNDRETVPYDGWRLLPQARAIVFDLMRRVEGVQLGRVLITRLGPGKKITPHVDQGAPAEFYTRYQIALQSLPGAIFRIGNEAVTFRTGDCWQIDNRTEHSVENNSIDDRIVLIADIRHG